MIRCIAIDDEPLALRQVKNYNERVEKLELVALCSNAIEAQELLKTEQVDLLFVDINMPDINGIDFVRGLTDPPLVIFTTAYSEYALEGFRLNAVDYLLKPFSFDDFSRAAEKACSLRELHRMRDERAASVSTIESIDEATDNNDYISIKSDYKVNLVRYNDIIYIESVGEYIRLHLKDGSKLTTLFRLKNMETELPQKNFMRVHRSYIVNIDYVSSFARGKIYLSNGDYVPISINYRDTFREHFEK
jgi:two-component system LytT family response regulator